jgi:chromosome segregation ATPase
MSKPTRPEWIFLGDAGYGREILGPDPDEAKAYMDALEAELRIYADAYTEADERISELEAENLQWVRESEIAEARIAELEAEVERYKFIAASGARDFEIQRERIAELEAENAELRDQRGHNHYMLTQAVEFLRRYLNDKFYADVAEFLSEMEDTDGQD